MNRFAIRVVAAACALAVQCPAVWAQSTEATPPAKAKELDTVTVNTGQAGQDRQASTASKIVVTRDDLARYGDTSVSDVLKRLPGVTVTGTSSRGVEIRMRGLGNGYTSVLLNGEPTAPGFSIDSLSPDLIDHIEVFRVGTADKSAQAVAGTINIVLKQVVRQAQRDLKLTASSENGRPSGVATGQWANRVGESSYILGAEYRHDAYAQPSVTHRQVTDTVGQVTKASITYSERDETYDSITLTPRVNWKIDGVNTLSADAFAQYQQYRAFWPDRYVTNQGPDPFITGVDARSSRGITNLRTRLNWTRKLEEAAQLDLKLGYSQSVRDLLVEYNSLDALDTLQRYRGVNGPATDRSWTFSGKYRAPLMTDHALSVGWDGERARRTEARIQTDITPTGLLTPVNLYETFDAQVHRLALFAQDEWEVTPRWSVYQGVRWEEIDTRSSGNGFDTVTNRSQVWSPTLQSVWKVPDTKSDQVRVGLSRTYKAPSTMDLAPRRRITATENTPTSADLEGNAQLRPELAWGLDLAYERYLAENGVLSANLFAREIKDVILYEVLQDNAGVWISRPVNSGQAHVFGIELEAKGNIKNWLAEGPSLDLRVNAARNWSRVDSVPGAHNRLGQQTPATLNLGADWRPSGTPLTIGSTLGIVVNGQVNTVSNQTAYGTVKRQWDAYGLWKVDARAQLRLSLVNLLHQTQVYDNSYQDANGGVSQSLAIPGHSVIRLALELKL